MSSGDASASAEAPAAAAASEVYTYAHVNQAMEELKLLLDATHHKSRHLSHKHRQAPRSRSRDKQRAASQQQPRSDLLPTWPRPFFSSAADPLHQSLLQIESAGETSSGGGETESDAIGQLRRALTEDNQFPNRDRHEQTAAAVTAEKRSVVLNLDSTLNVTDQKTHPNVIVALEEPTSKQHAQATFECRSATSTTPSFPGGPPNSHQLAERERTDAPKRGSPGYPAVPEGYILFPPYSKPTPKTDMFEYRPIVPADYQQEAKKPPNYYTPIPTGYRSFPVSATPRREEDREPTIASSDGEHRRSRSADFRYQPLVPDFEPLKWDPKKPLTFERVEKACAPVGSRDRLMTVDAIAEIQQDQWLNMRLRNLVNFYVGSPVKYSPWPDFALPTFSHDYNPYFTFGRSLPPLGPSYAARTRGRSLERTRVPSRNSIKEHTGHEETSNQLKRETGADEWCGETGSAYHRRPQPSEYIELTGRKSDLRQLSAANNTRSDVSASADDEGDSARDDRPRTRRPQARFRPKPVQFPAYWPYQASRAWEGLGRYTNYGMHGALPYRPLPPMPYVDPMLLPPHVYPHLMY